MSDPMTLQQSANQGMGSTGQQILTYLDDTSVQRAELPGTTGLRPNAMYAGKEKRTHTIEDILSRPARIAFPIWEAAQNPNTTLLGANGLVFPDVLFAKEIIANKLKNFTFLRADICVRIIANTTPFQAGKLLAYFSPLAKAIGERAQANNFLASKTCFPHAILDASVGNVVELRIPYVNPYNHYNLTTTYNEMGTLYLDVLNTLRSGTGTEAPISVFAWFENIDLSIPTPAAFLLPPVVPVPPTMSAQVNTEQEDKTEIGIITDVTSKFSSFSKAAEGLPIVGEVFEPLTWMSKIAARTAGALGLCKPQSVATNTKFVNIPANAYTNGEGVDEGCVLAVVPSNVLQERTDVFGSNVDEMDIAYITRRLALRDTFPWVVGLVGDLQRYYVHPMDMKKDSTPVSNRTFYEPTMVGFVSAAFELWRGSLRYKVQVAKTAYHSGRLRISYVPGGKKLTDVYDYDHAYSWILDLRTSNEIEFEVPYTAVTPWLSTVEPDDLNIQRTVGGVLCISVLNNLIAPSTVSSQVDINVWVSGGSDFELARPTVSKYIPVSLPPLPTMRAQVNEDDQTIGFNDFGTAAEMFQMAKTSTVDAAALSVGEAVLNLRTVIKRFGVAYVGNIINKSTVVQIPSSSFGKLTNINDQDNGELPLPLHYFSWIYRFFRGGMNYKIFSRARTWNYRSGGNRFLVEEKGQVRSVTSLQNIPIFDATATTLVDFQPWDSGNFHHTTSTDVNFAHEINVPYYTNSSIQPIFGPDFAVGPNGGTDLPALEFNKLLLAYESSNILLPDPNNIRVRFEILKAGADDLQFGWLVGPPRLAVYTGVTADAWTPLA